MKTIKERVSVPAESPAGNKDRGKSLMSFFGKVRDKFRYHLVLQSISDALESVGITVVPYYIFEEYFADKLSQNLNVETELAPLTFGFLSYLEIEEICRSPEGKELEIDREKLRGDDCRCFALKHNGEVVSYMLCNFRQCDSRLVSFPLKEGEVYLSGAYTFNAYRGKNLVTVVEYELYKQLYAMGLKKYHSLNVLYNKPSLKFKEKLQSRPAKLCLYLSLFHKLHWSFTVKRYRR